MMRSLYIQVAVRVMGVLVASVVVIMALTALLLHGLDPMHRDPQGRPFQGLNLQEVAKELDQLPAADRRQALEAVSLRSGAPLTLREAGEPPIDGPPPFLEPALLASGQRIELGWPSPSPPFALVSLFIAVLGLAVVGSSVAVTWPLVHRLRRLEQMIRALGDGQAELHVEPTQDEIGAVERVLRWAAHSVHQRMTERQELLQAVSHELATPLTRMRFDLERHGAGAPPALIQAITSEIEALDALSAELAAYVGADSGPMTRVDVHLGDAVLVAVDLARDAWARAVEVEVIIPEALGAERLVVAPRQFHRALENITRNALDWAVHKVRVEVRASPSAVTIAVHDDGPGIPEDQRAHVIEPFVRLDKSRSRSAGGVGLGLAITHRIVDRHGGVLAIGDSDLGGAAVSLSFPRGPR